MLKLLRNVDQFGVFFQPRVKYSQNQYKTYCGGLMSILLYGLSLTYLIYIFYQWNTGEILPKITVQQIVREDYKLAINETYIQLQLRQQRNTSVDPFDPKAIVLQPVVNILKNGIPLQEQQPLQYEFIEDGFYILKISNLTITISEEKTEENAEFEYLLAFCDCQVTRLKEGEQCANPSIVNQFYEQLTNTMVVKQYVKQYNTITKQLEIIPRESLIPIQKSLTYYAQTFVQLTQTKVDQGFLFESIEDYSYITQFRTTSVILDKDYSFSIIGEKIYLVFLYEIDNIQVQQTIAYSKISEILADAGSIASSILVLSYIIVILNQNQLQFDAINKVISMYYPDFKNLKIRRNIFGKIYQVEKNNRILDLETFKKSYEKLSRVAEMKLTISNQIYEISRLQFLIQTIFTKQIIQQIHQKGLPLQMNYLDVQNEENQSVEISMVQDLQFKRSTILPSNERSSKQYTLQVLESKSNMNTIDQQLVDPIYTDGDFDLLILPNDEIQKNTELNNLNIQQN